MLVNVATVADLSWEKLLKEGKASLSRAKAQVRAIQRSIRAIEKKIASGEPFPGSVRK
jgi:asparagine synthetase A